MGEIVDIEKLRSDFKEKSKSKELQEFAEHQQMLIEKLLKEIEVQKVKTKQLEVTISLLPKKEFFHNVSPEEMICIEQIAMLKTKSSNRDLTLEETKKLDILVKSLKLIREETPKESTVSSVSMQEEDALVAAAIGQSE